MGSVLIIILLVAVLAVIVGGVFLMGKGGEANKKYGNQLMMARVTIQALILLVIFAMFFSAGK